MPLSKKRDKERKRLARLEMLSSASQTSNPVQPDALQSTTRPLKEKSNGKLLPNDAKATMEEIKALDKVVKPKSVEVIEEWTPEKHTISIDGVVSRVEANPLGMIPIVILDAGPYRGNCGGSVCKPEIDADGEPIYEESA